MRTTLSCLSVLLGLAWTAWIRGSELQVLISSAPATSARIDPKLFGNFMELLEDAVPGTWAEMLNDRSFEGVVPAANWCYFDGAPTICDRRWDANGTWDCETNHVFNGRRCARLSASRSHPASLTQSGLNVRKGAKYRFSGYFRSSTPGSVVTIVLKALVPDGTWMRLAAARLPGLDAAWRKHCLELVSTGTTDRAVFEVRVEGEGSLWADKLSLMPADNLDGWRADVIDAIKAAHPAVLRWGGSACDPGQYRWKDGIGDPDLRVPFANHVWGRIDSNDVGIDEFCLFAARVGAEPLICLSFSDGPQSAADLVEYCNGGAETAWGGKRAAHGHAAPYGVKYWQIGNEIDGDNPQYLARLGDFARLMKAKDSSIALCSSFPSRKLLERFGQDLAFVCPHHWNRTIVN